ncbi:carbohydrate kinase [Parafrankia sp. BMG5.11]|nr:carbohydrate kinase [Parafrankia sp. BMG5.11]
MLDRQVRANQSPFTGDYVALDTAATGEWILQILSEYGSHPVECIIPVSHGAAVAGIANDGLAFVPPDYEWAMPEDARLSYQRQRAPFAKTGSPSLPAGLNLGAQLHWLESSVPRCFNKATLLPYAQYWTWLLSGNAVSEVSSLGCHSDLWCPAEGHFSPLAQQRGWARRFAPLARAGDVIGTLRPELAARMGLSEQTRIHAGLHDSNAALLAARGFREIEDNEATVLSTGTWFIAMRLTREPVDLSALPEDRDCLVNVDVYGTPVPSARFMGGREIETLIELDTRQVDIKPDQPLLIEAVPGLFASGAMVLPTLAPGNGPFGDARGGWHDRPDDWHARRAGACLYAALVTDVSLDLIGSKERLVVEGRFAEAEVFVRALAALRPETRVYVANAHNDVSFGALRLANPDLRPTGELRLIDPLDGDIAAYRATWRERAGHPA